MNMFERSSILDHKLPHENVQVLLVQVELVFGERESVVKSVDSCLSPLVSASAHSLDARTRVLDERISESHLLFDARSRHLIQQDR